MRMAGAHRSGHTGVLHLRRDSVTIGNAHARWQLNATSTCVKHPWPADDHAGGAMLIPMAIDLHGSDDWQVFTVSALLTAFVGVAVWLSTSQREPFDLGLKGISAHERVLLLIGVFGSFPFMFCELALSPTDAIFESVSGITTTGQLFDIEAASHGILIWRALLQWLGGVGIVVMAVAVCQCCQWAECSCSALGHAAGQRKSCLEPPSWQVVSGLFMRF